MEKKIHGYGKTDLKTYLRKVMENVGAEKQDQQSKNMFAKHLDEKAIDLIARMLEYNPKRRITAEEALKHAYFTEAPLPSQPHEIPKIEGELKELAFREARNQKINAAAK